MKIYFASPGIDTGAMDNDKVEGVLFSFYDLSGKGIYFTKNRREAFYKMIGEEPDENKDE